MKINEIRKLDDSELAQELKRQQFEMMQLRFSKTARNLEDHTKVRKTRRIIAGVKTVIREREIIRETS